MAVVITPAPSSSSGLVEISCTGCGEFVTGTLVAHSDLVRTIGAVFESFHAAACLAPDSPRADRPWALDLEGASRAS